jgi:hypothetical protein
MRAISSEHTCVAAALALLVWAFAAPYYRCSQQPPLRVLRDRSLTSWRCTYTCGASPGSKMRMYGEVPHPPLRSTAICPQKLFIGAKATLRSKSTSVPIYHSARD